MGGGKVRENELSLKKFVDLCNNTDGFGEKVGDSANKLGTRIINAKENGLAIEAPNSFSDINDLYFYNSLVERKEKLKGCYCFLQDNSVIAQIDPFEPFYDKEYKLLNQKWHVLISVLAYLDIANSDCEYALKMDEKYKIGKIDRIEFNYQDRKIKIHGSRKATRWYVSKLMNEWIFEHVLKNANLG